VVSLWEIQIKTQLGKLSLTTSLADMVTTQLQVNAIRILPVELTHVLALDQLPLHHKDPFDRLLVAQAICEGASLATVDAMVARYPVPIIF
jgi:PIN domain nuclease of toxin-antitoxin system